MIVLYKSRSLLSITVRWNSSTCIILSFYAYCFARAMRAELTERAVLVRNTCKDSASYVDNESHEHAILRIGSQVRKIRKR